MTSILYNSEERFSTETGHLIGIMSWTLVLLPVLLQDATGQRL